MLNMFQENTSIFLTHCQEHTFALFTDDFESFLMLIFNSDLGNFFNFSLMSHSAFFLFTLRSVTPWTFYICMLSLPSMITISMVLQYTLLFSSYIFSETPVWVSFLKILLSHDIEPNPGDFTNTFFSFCNWNVNSLAKDNFQRINLIEAHNALCLYNLISLCEMSLNDSVEIPDRSSFSKCDCPGMETGCSKILIVSQ